MFNKHFYTLILGSANSGKTSWFLKKKNLKKLIVSVVDLKDILPLNLDESNFNTFNCKFINLSKILKLEFYNDYNNGLMKFLERHQPNEFIKPEFVYLFEKTTKQEYSICIDEIHFFKTQDLVLLDYLLNGYMEIYFTMLPQSDNNNFLPQTSELFLNCNNIILVSSNCQVCEEPTIQSNAKTQRHEFGEICNKSMFVTMCKNCKHNKLIKD